ncbi:MAG: AAA family ATPase [Phycisphaerales bacterium]
MVAIFMPSIVTDTKPLSEEFLPTTFPGREAQLKELIEQVTPPGREWRPSHLWIHGPPGSGKSSTVRKMLGQLEEHNIKTAYVNCWSAQTFYAVLEAIFQELRTLVAEMRDVSFKFDRLGRIAKGQRLVVVLDEVDQMFLKERNAALYNLARLDHSGVVALSQSRQGYLELDPRVKSRLLPFFLEFSAYSVEQLVQILEARAAQSLEADAWCRKDIEIIAKQSNGDARVAIQTLRAAAYRADKGRGSQIRPTDIEEGLRSTSGLRRRYALKSLSEQHRLLHHLVKDAGVISTLELWKRYRKEASKHEMEPMARRTFTHYKQQLIANRLLKERAGHGRRNVRFLEVIE